MTKYDLITDRTQADVERAQYLEGLRYEDMTDMERAEYLAGVKGAYKLSDWERVYDVAYRIASRLYKWGIARPDNLSYTRTFNSGESYTPVEAIATEFVERLKNLRAMIPVTEDTPTPPDSIDQLDYQTANDIERMLYIMYDLAWSIDQMWQYCGDIYAGEG